MNNLNDENLIQEFVAESKEHLASIEPDFLILEKEGDKTDPEIINRIFRAIHSIKGASGFFGFSSLKNLSHVMENLLMSIRDKKCKPSPELIDPLLRGVDKLNLMLENVHESDQISIEEELAQFEVLLNGGSPLNVTTDEPAKTVESEKNKEGSSSSTISKTPAAADGQMTYQLQFYLNKDLQKKSRSLPDLFEQLSSLGQILDTGWDESKLPTLESCLEQDVPFFVTFSTILDRELLIEALELDDDNILEPSEPDKKAEVQQEASPGAKNLPEDKSSNNPENPTSKPGLKKSSAGNHDSTESIRVRIDLLNKLMELAGEMVLSRNQLLRTLGREEHKISGLANIVQNIDLITSDLQEHIMQTRMQPVGSVFGKFPRVVRDMARQLGKNIELITSGEDVELDKSIIESLSDPLTHLIRNCCDHAIEAPDERERLGKPATGIISLRAFHEDGQINIAISDDGRGIDTEKIARKALEHGLVTEADVRKMTHQEKANLIFLPGLSTAEKISEVSGRGVGMDVVKTNITKIGGHIKVETEPGRGTTLILRLPLTLAIIPSLIVGVAGQRFAIPQINLIELVHIRASEISTRIEKIGSASVLRLRGKLLPLLRLADTLGLNRTFTDPASGEIKPDRRQVIHDVRVENKNFEKARQAEAELLDRRESSQSDYNILVLKVGMNQFGLIVDELFDMEEIVVKPLSSYLKNCKCFSGATIMGDGRVAMILDPGGIISYSDISFEAIEMEKQRLETLQRESEHTAQNKQTVLLFNNAEDEVFAIPLSAVLRLEKVKLGQIQNIGHEEFINYYGKGLPLIRLENFLPVKAMPEGREEAFLIIPKDGNGRAGILASRIIDTLETDAALDEFSFCQAGLKGSAVVNEHLTLFIEPKSLLEKAGFLVDGGCNGY
jgi:two-component system chemotaxis sensor kinase CheA